MSKKVKNDITGKKFNMLTAIKFIPTEGKLSKYLFLCECGEEKIIFTQSVIRGLTKSCGCYQKQVQKNKNTTHGHSGKGRTKTYNSWAGMMDRCEWGGHPSYSNYGAVGKRVCKRWHDFSLFLADMGERPDNTSIDRIDNTKGYFPGNCRWATRREQALNTSRTIVVKYNGEKIPAHILCEKLDISKKALRSRAVRRGNNYIEAFLSLGIDVTAV